MKNTNHLAIAVITLIFACGTEKNEITNKNEIK